MRLVHSASDCSASEAATQWNQTGRTGLAGPTCPTGISGYEEKMASDTITLAPGDNQGIDVSCPSGQKALGRGGLSAGGFTLLGTGPSGINNDRWFADFVNTTGVGGTSTVTVFAICANVS